MMLCAPLSEQYHKAAAGGVQGLAGLDATHPSSFESEGSPHMEQHVFSRISTFQRQLDLLVLKRKRRWPM